MADLEALRRLLQWRMGLEGPDADLPDSHDLRDWLWLSAQLDGVQLPWRFTVPQRQTQEGEEVHPSPDEPSLSTTDGTGAGQPPEARTPALPDPHLPTPFPADPPAPEPAAEPLARLLADNLLPDEAEVMETLERRHGAVSLRVRQLALLPYPLQILHALRPLLQRRAHPRWRVLDEESSATKSAEMGLPWPVFRPRRVPMVAVRVVLDGGVSMAVWEPLAQELQRVLASSQAFRRVDLQRLVPPHFSPRQTTSGVDADTTVTLLLSDTAGHHWWDGSIEPWLQREASQQPLVVLHTLPLRYWASTALQGAQAVTLRNGEALANNSRYQPLAPLRDPWDEPEATTSQPPPDGICLPVISLDRRELGPWAALVTGDGRARCAGRLLPAAEPHTPEWADQPTAAGEISQEEAERLWQEFARRASPEARELMLSMAASVLLSLPVLRLLQAAEAPKAFSPQPLAEVLVSGLVRRLPEQERVAAIPERLQFELLPAVRRVLEPRLGPERRRQVLAAVTDLLERHWNRQGGGSSFRALLLGPKDVLERDHPDLFHIANVTASMLDQLPGRQFRELAAQLRGRELVAPGPVWPASMAFGDLEYESAQLLAIPEPEPIHFITARFQEMDLHPISFTTATVTIGSGGVKTHKSTATTWAFFEPLRRDGLLPGDVADAADPLTLTLVEIPAGEFKMGTPPDESDHSDDEGPQHPVHLEGFFMSQTPITQAHWRTVAQWDQREGESLGRQLNPEPSRFQGEEARLLEGEANTDQRPVESVSWHEAMEFCSRLSQRTGRHYTLPSEAQWEYACRAGTTSPFHWGEMITTDLANYNGQSTYGDGPKGENRQQTAPVGSFPANAWGLQDMHGNVWEWCLDAWHESYEGAPGDGSAWLDEEAEEDAWRLLRGGSWIDGPRSCRSAFRLHLVPGLADDLVGFRVVCLPQGPAS